MISIKDIKILNIDLKKIKKYIEEKTNKKELLLETGKTKVINNIEIDLERSISLFKEETKKVFKNEIKELKESTRIKKDKSLEIKLIIIYIANEERFIMQYIYDLKKEKENKINKVEKNKYEIKIFNEKKYIELVEKKENNKTYLRKINNAKNELEQLKYIIFLIKENLIRIKNA